MSERINVKIIKAGDTIIIDDGYTAPRTEVVTSIGSKGEVFVDTKQIYESNIRQVNGEYWLRSLSRSSEVPGLDIIIKVWEEGQYGNNETSCLYQALSRMCSEASIMRDRYIMQLNEQVADGIKKLSQEDAWTNLSAIAKHAMDEAVNATRRDDADGSIGSRMVDHYQLKADFLKLGSDQYPEFIRRLQDFCYE